MRFSLALAAFVCLLVVAAGLRFYDLSEKSLRSDEAVAANSSRGALSEIVSNTRKHNSSPILYPLALWAVQKVDVSAFSIRVLPGTASVLTVAALLFLLPRAGVSRRAAFLAALLATLSVEAIRHAQDAREYSIDALLSVLMIAGLLWYLRDGRKVMLCVSLFLAPLLQYGLFLFGVAVICAAIVLSSPSPIWRRRQNRSYLNSKLLSRIRNYLKPRIALVQPAVCFLAGCAISYAVTLRYQQDRRPDPFVYDYLSTYYYQGNFDLPSIFEFSVDGIWSLLMYHLPEVVAMAVLILLGLAFLGKFQGNFSDNAIAVLFLFCIAVSVGAAVLRNIRLGAFAKISIWVRLFSWRPASRCHGQPVVCLRSRASAGGGGGGGGNAALLVITCGIALAGVSAMRQASPYYTHENIKSVLAVLKEQMREEDMVYAYLPATAAIRFYQGIEKRPPNWYYGTFWCKDSDEPCLREMVYSIGCIAPNVPNRRIFLVHRRRSILEGLERLGVSSVKHVVAEGIFNLSLIANANEFGESAVRCDFDVYIDDNTLRYVKEPCAPVDTKARFFLHLIPANVADLPDHRKQYGFDNLDFDFDGRGVISDISDGKCMIRMALSEYDITRIRTGQFVPGEGQIWKEEIPFPLGFD